MYCIIGNKLDLHKDEKQRQADNERLAAMVKMLNEKYDVQLSYRLCSALKDSSASLCKIVDETIEMHVKQNQKELQEFLHTDESRAALAGIVDLDGLGLRSPPKQSNCCNKSGNTAAAAKRARLDNKPISEMVTCMTTTAPPRNGSDIIVDDDCITTD